MAAADSACSYACTKYQGGNYKCTIRDPVGMTCADAVKVLTLQTRAQKHCVSPETWRDDEPPNGKAWECRLGAGSDMEYRRIADDARSFTLELEAGQEEGGSTGG
jgi:hypothetical protein